jgi:phenylpropionate dioxygenase-like ring-hydroxylating dioxygenase large terminal subunit
MRHDEQVALARRTLRHLEAGTSERGEPARSPRSRYLDPQRFARELDRVVREHPLAVAPAAPLAAPGSTLAVDVAGTPLLLARGEDGVLRAFVNACRHRGARLLDPQAPEAPRSGHRPAVRRPPRVRRALVCPYHSWTYGLDAGCAGGRTRRTSRTRPRPSTACCRCPPARRWGSRGWCRARPGRASPSRWTCAPRSGRFGEDLRGFGYDAWVPFHARRFSCAANWKLPFEANLETYHFQYAHRETIAALFFDNLVIADHDGPHHRLFLPKRSIESLRGQPEAQWDLSRHANIIYCFFPCTFLLHEGDHANLFTVVPDAADRCTVLGATLIPEPPATEKARRHWERNVESFWGALDEDFALSASIQSTLACGATDDLLLGASEWCSAKFHADVERLLGREGSGG